jgi:hypothetical protein
MIEPDLKASVGMSRKWDAREAGREVARKTIEKLETPPKFFILFSTIHYKKHGGFQELLNGVYDVLPESIPLIGGTVTGFMNNEGCFTRGTSSLAVSCPYMDVSIGYGKNTKRNPKKAAKKCSKMVKNGLKESNYQNKFLLNLISAGEIPNIAGLGRKKVIRSGFTPMMSKMLGFSQYFLQKGAGRDDEVIQEIINECPDYYMLGGGTYDDGSGLENYQFFNKDVLKTSVVSLGIKTKYSLNVLTTHNMKKSDINFKITKISKDGRSILEINGKPATTELLRLMSWPEDFINDKTWYKIAYHFPLGFRINQEVNEFAPRVIAVILGESLITTISSMDPDASVLTIDGRNLLKTIDDNLENYQISPSFGLISSCTTRLITMGDKIYQARDKISSFFNNKPFLVFYVGGESTYSPDNGLKFVNMSFNTAIFWNNQNKQISS